MPDTLESAAPVRRRRSDAQRNIDAIIGAARIVLGDRPDASMEDIAAAAGVTRQTVYAHFPSRDDPLAGQKTGWFFDQRQNRGFVATLARGGARVLDLYCYTGGFSVQAARSGAAEVVGIDRSEPALAFAGEAAVLNRVDDICTFRRGEAFGEAARLNAEGERFDIVIADPPAFAKSRKEAAAALRGYRKLTRLAAGVTARGGTLFLASCSYNVGEAEFAEAVRRGLADAGRNGRIIRTAGAGPDHPVHPSLPETAYLKSVTLSLD